MSRLAELQSITERIRERSKPTREPYLDRLRAAVDKGPHRSELSCGNLAHGFAACGPLYVAHSVAQLRDWLLAHA